MSVAIRSTFGKTILRKESSQRSPIDPFSSHFTYRSSADDELSIGINQIFHVTDTLYNGQVGAWVATKLNPSLPESRLTGAIPNTSR